MGDAKRRKQLDPTFGQVRNDSFKSKSKNHVRTSAGASLPKAEMITIDIDDDDDDEVWERTYELQKQTMREELQRLRQLTVKTAFDTAREWIYSAMVSEYDTELSINSEEFWELDEEITEKIKKAGNHLYLYSNEGMSNINLWIFMPEGDRSWVSKIFDGIGDWKHYDSLKKVKENLQLLHPETPKKTEEIVKKVTSLQNLKDCLNKGIAIKTSDDNSVALKNAFSVLSNMEEFQNAHFEITEKLEILLTGTIKL